MARVFGGERFFGGFAGRLCAYRTPRATHALRLRVVAMASAATKTHPVIGRRVKSNGRTPGFCQRVVEGFGTDSHDQVAVHHPDRHVAAHADTPPAEHAQLDKPVDCRDASAHPISELFVVRHTRSLHGRVRLRNAATPTQSRTGLRRRAVNRRVKERGVCPAASRAPRGARRRR